MSEKIFSGDVKGKVLKRKAKMVTERIKRARYTFGGIGRIGIPYIAGAARADL